MPSLSSPSPAAGPLQLLHLVLLAALLALPWLWPFTAGPLPAVQPYLAAAYCGAVVLALWTRTAQRGAQAAACGWLLAAVASAVIAQLQYFDLETPFYPWINIAKPGQAFGNLRQPNQLATLLVIGLAALRFLTHGGRRATQVCAAALALLLLAGTAATASRTGLVELLALTVVLLMWSGRRHWRRVLLLALAALAAYALAAYALPALLQTGNHVAGRDLLDRLQHAEGTCGSRLILWGNVLHLIAQKPWLGWGWGDLAWAHYITLYPGARFCYILDNAHNLPLHLAVSLGVPAAVLICVALAFFALRARPWSEQNPARQMAWCVLLAIGVHSLVEYPLWYGPFQTAAIISLWLLWVTRKGRSAAKPAAWGALPRAALALVMLAATSYTAWDYERISQLYLPPEERHERWPGQALQEARRSRLFADDVAFAELTVQQPSRANAPWMLQDALRLLHYSPEPRVIERVIESAIYLGHDDIAKAHMARYRVAFPREWDEWRTKSAHLLQRN
ncbi:MAG: O-antigen ligase C-terminal domain-containing protein [Ottowia sp.]|nr:O-antigen ligase C-terminal domain-containing protein [Ottowia sp.]